jgi:hypothetical protein
MARYIVKVEPLASAPAAQVAAAVGPTLQRYLTGDVTDAGPGRYTGAARQAAGPAPAAPGTG